MPAGPGGRRGGQHHQLVATALRYEGFQVEVARSGRDALRAATSFRPHLIVLDLMLPGLDGFEVQRRLAADRLHVPILFLTARDTTQAMVHGLTMGADDYVTKPFSLEADLHALARRQLSRVVQPRLMQLRRLVIGEVGRFPELGRAFYERGAAARSPRSPTPSRTSPSEGCCGSTTRSPPPPTSTGWSCRRR